MRSITVIALFAIAFMFTSCMVKGPLYGGLYTGTQSSVTATGLSKAPKMGEACAMSILGAIAIGDASIDTARKNGRISKISMVDDRQTSFLFGLYSQYCTVVHGR